VVRDVEGVSSSRESEALSNDPEVFSWILILPTNSGRRVLAVHVQRPAIQAHIYGYASVACGLPTLTRRSASRSPVRNRRFLETTETLQTDLEFGTVLTNKRAHPDDLLVNLTDGIELSHPAVSSILGEKPNQQKVQQMSGVHPEWME
jgi:hypothetical protein